MLGKTFKGMTDEMLAWQTARVPRARGRSRRAHRLRPARDRRRDRVQRRPALVALSRRLRAAVRARRALSRRQDRRRGRHDRRRSRDRDCGRRIIDDREGDGEKTRCQDDATLPPPRCTVPSLARAAAIGTDRASCRGRPRGGARCSATTGSRRRSAEAAWASCTRRDPPVIGKRAAIKVLHAELQRSRRRSSGSSQEARVGQPDRPPEHRRRVRVRHAARRPQLLRHGVAAGRDAARAAARAARCRSTRRATIVDAARARARGRARQGHRPPRSQARQRVPRRRAGPAPTRQAARLRHREARCATDRDRRRPRPARSSARRCTSRPSRRAATRSITAPTSTRSACMLFEMLTGRPPFVAKSAMRDGLDAHDGSRRRGRARWPCSCRRSSTSWSRRCSRRSPRCGRRSARSPRSSRA